MGALLATALFVVPAATVRLLTRRLLAWQLGSVALVAVEGTAGLWLSVEANVPPGAAIAVLAGGAFAATAALRAVPALRLAAPAAAALLLLAGCGSTATSNGRLDVVATTTQIGDWARNVGGCDVDVHQILQPNTDPHEYEPRPSDVEAAARAKLVLENGDGLDRWMEKVLSSAGGGPAVVVLGDRVPERRPGAGSDRVDPHWWHDPRNAVAAVGEIRDALVRADPAHAARYRRAAAAYTAKLTALDRGIAACIATVPRAQRKLVTDHDAFGYFAARYGLDVVGAVIPSQTTQAQPSAGETAKLIALIRREHVKAVFPESSLNPKLARTIAARDRRPRRPHALRRHARPGRLAGRDVPLDGAGERRRDRARPHRRRARLPVDAVSAPLLAADGLAVGYGGPPVLEDVTFALEPGERIGVLGPNGGGKSTLFRALLGELAPTRGSIREGGRLGYVPQTERSRLDYPVSALDVALMGTLSRLAWWRRPTPRRPRARARLARPRRARAARAHAVRRALRRPAAARARRPRARAGRVRPPPRRAVHGHRPRQRRTARTAPRRPRRRGARPPRRDPRPRPGARLRPGALPEPAPGRVRPAGGDAHARGARGDVRRRDRHAPRRGRRRRASSRPTTTGTTDAPRRGRPVVAGLPPARVPRARARRDRNRPARLLGRLPRALVQRRVARARALPRARRRDDRRRAARPRRRGRRARRRRARSRSSAGRRRSGATPPSRSSSRRCSGSASCSRSRRRRRRACRSSSSATCSPSPAPTSR